MKRESRCYLVTQMVFTDGTSSLLSFPNLLRSRYNTISKFIADTELLSNSIMIVSSSKDTLSLDQGQQYALQALREGKSMALIGGAGCGKSFLLNILIREARSLKGEFPTVVACAHSNRAASAMNGVTMHSLFGAKPSWEFSKEYLWKSIKSKPWLRERLEKIGVLIIDEISLLRSNEIDSIDFVLRQLAKSEWHSSLPFGGRTIIAAGDPFQLEPYQQEGTIQVEARQTFFQSRAWYLTFGAPGDGVVVMLKHNHRQAEDTLFFNVLNRIRTGMHSPEDLQELNSTSARIANPPRTHTRLLTTREQVQAMNDEFLRTIHGSVVELTAYDTYFVSQTTALESRLASTAPGQVSVKVGAFVILTRKCGWALPGTQGVIRDIKKLTRHRQRPRFEIGVEVSSFGEPATTKVIRVGPERFDIHGFDLSVLATREQIPIIPGYAMTVHRSQGMTMSYVAVDFDTANTWRPCGLVYVALSRCSTKAGLWVKNLGSRHIRISRRAISLMFELWTLREHMPSRISGVNKLTHLGIEDHSDSDNSDESEGENNLMDLVIATDSESVQSVQSMKAALQPTVAGSASKRHFIWRSQKRGLFPGGKEN